MATPQQHLENIIKYREAYNEALQDIGFLAPTPKAGQTGGNYRRTALQTFADSLLPQRHQYAQVDYLNIPYDALKVLEPQVLKACVDEYQNPNNVLPGRIREITKKDGLGHKMIRFIGRDWFGGLPNLGVPLGNISFGGGARPGRRMRIFNQLTGEWFPPVRR